MEEYKVGDKFLIKYLGVSRIEPFSTREEYVNYENVIGVITSIFQGCYTLEIENKCNLIVPKSYLDKLERLG